MALYLTPCEPIAGSDISADEREAIADRIECGDFELRPSERFHRGSSGRLNAVTPRIKHIVVIALRNLAS